MNVPPAVRPPWTFWLICAATLSYNVAGVANFVSQMTVESIAGLPEPYRTMVEGRAVWVTVAFAAAVFGGAGGCVLLLIRKSLAYPVFVVSLAGAFVTMAHTLAMDDPFPAPAGAVVGNLLQLGVTAFLMSYAKRADRKGWIR